MTIQCSDRISMLITPINYEILLLAKPDIICAISSHYNINVAGKMNQNYFMCRICVVLWALACYIRAVVNCCWQKSSLRWPLKKIEREQISHYNVTILCSERKSKLTTTKIYENLMLAKPETWNNLCTA
jgi:hypothetical protein